MKIAIPVNDQSIKSGVCQSFGRAPYFLIYSMSSKEEEFLDNSAAANQGGAGIKAAQLIADQKVDAVLTPRCGQNAVDVLEQSAIKLYQTKGESIQDNIDDFVANQLSILTNTHPGFHNHGGK